MPPGVQEKPVDDSVAKVNGEISVGEDLVFQRKWWRFERIVWIVFSLILLLDLAGVFGRGPFAHARRKTSDGSMEVKYDRVQRTGTPSIMTINFGPAAIHDRKLQLFVSESVVKELGAQRIIPSPESTTVGESGLTYSFPASTVPASVEFALEPSGPGLQHFTLRLSGSEEINGDVVVVP